MAKQQKILLRRSSVKGKMPSSATGSSVEIGELLLNNASGDAENFLTTLRAGGSSAVTSDYIKWSDDATNEKKFATKGELEDSEFVTATALNQINASVGLTEGGISQLPNQQTLTDAIIDLQNKTKDLEESDPIFTDSPAAGITDDDIENWDNKLDKYGKAVSAQTADFATDLTGRIETTSEVFTYRPSAGDKSIKDNNAFIRRVKGNSVVFNQIAKEINSANWKAYNSNNASISFNSNIATVTVTNYASDIYGYAAGACLIQNSSIIPNHKYLIAVEVKSDIAMDFGIELNSTYSEIGFVTNEWTYCTKIATSNRNYTNLIIGPRSPYTAELNTYSFRNLICIDLTQMFGTGNEPTTVEEFRALYPDSYYPYNAGELRNLNCYGIKTVGFNQWDEQWEVGYLKTDGTTAGYVQNYIRAKNYIPVIGGAMYYASVPDGTSDAQLFAVDENYNLIKQIQLWVNNQFFIPDGAAYIRFYMNYGSEVYDNDICINLHHTGYRDGEYEPYKEVTHALPLSQITNGEPLRKAGSVYDEINETEYIRRVGVVDLGSLNWSYTSSNNFFTCYDIPNMKITDTDVERLDGLFCTKYPIDTNVTVSTQATDKTMKRHDGWLHIRDTSFTDSASFKASLSGVLLQYELAEPIITPIETPIDFNYYVEDFGTEEAILAENSAPFSADIIYQFNAVDRIRQNDLNIDRLDKELLLKQDNIEDLETIRNNATSGAVAYGWGNHASAGYLTGYTEQYKGTITGIQMNGESKGTSGVVDLGTVLTSTAIKVNSASTADSATTSVSATTANKVDKFLKVGSKNYNGSSEVTITAADLGLETALKYHGVTTTPLTDGATTIPITIGGTNHYQSAGCVVIYSTTASGSTEFVWNGNKWEKLGDGINYKVKQEAVSEPVANGSALTFIDTISQDTNGVITATKKAVNLSHNHDTVYWKRTERVNSASTADSAIKDGSGNNIVSTYATKSSIPTSATVSNWGFTKNAGTVTSVKVQGTNGLTGSGTVTASGTITISGITATSAATGVSKLVTGNLNGKTYTKGEAAAAAHTHSQYLTGLPSHNHDDRYYTESEIDTKLAGKSDTGHTHSEYATTTALNDLIGDIEDNELVISTIVTKINDSCGFDENSESVLPNGQKLTEAIIELQGQLPVTLPTASTTILGIMKVGSFLTATTGNVSVSTGTTSSTVARGDHGHAASSITSGTFNTARIPTGITVSKAISATTSVSATTSHSATTVYSTTANSKVYLVGVTGTGSSYQQLYKNTGVTMSASCIYATSDERLKDFKGDIECDLEKLKNIPKKYFSWKDDESKTIQIGTSAQEVHKLYPEIVSIDDDGTHSVAYDRLSIVALSAIDKLYDMVKELQAKNDELENRIKELENK